MNVECVIEIPCTPFVFLFICCHMEHTLMLHSCCWGKQIASHSMCIVTRHKSLRFTSKIRKTKLFETPEDVVCRITDEGNETCRNKNKLFLLLFERDKNAAG